MDELYGNDYEANDNDKDSENAQADNDAQTSPTPNRKSAGFGSPNRHKESLLSSQNYLNTDTSKLTAKMKNPLQFLEAKMKGRKDFTLGYLTYTLVKWLGCCLQRCCKKQSWFQRQLQNFEQFKIAAERLKKESDL